MAKARTGPQKKHLDNIGRAATAAIDMLSGISSPDRPGNYDTYRDMLTDPTIALARATVVSPILAGSWTFEHRQNTPAEAVKLVQEQFEPIRASLIADCLEALDFGWKPFELVGQYDGQWLNFAKIKPLLQDITIIQENPDTGDIVGLKNRDVELEAGKAMLFALNATTENPYGRPRLENIRKHGWKMWKDCNESASRYDRKVAGVYMILHYLNKMIQMPGGADIDPFTDAQRMAHSMAAGNMIVSPEYPATDEREGPKSHYRIEMVEDRGARQGSFIERLRYADELKFRGYLRPERSGLSATTGGIGTSDTADMMGLALLDGELLHRQICDTLNRQAVNRLLLVNFGPAAVGSVYITPAPLVDKKLAIFLDFIKMIGTSPGGIEWLTSRFSIDAMADALGLPRITGNEQGGDGLIAEGPSDGSRFVGETADRMKKLMEHASAKEA